LQVAAGLFTEVDLRREARNLKLFAAAHAHLPYVTVRAGDD
jgi:predicted unusual protein kinase regulating ubiquinone biosynthesis (AarF/ABC1/UbiB family)